MTIEVLDDTTLPVWISMRRDFWEDDEATVKSAYERYKTQRRDGTAITFFAVDENGQYSGFLDGEIRVDYVQGAAASPVWYLEGIYVVPERRASGVGAFLLSSFEAHVRDQGFSEIASDCDLENVLSEAFHKAKGFREVLRTIHFAKDLS